MHGMRVGRSVPVIALAIGLAAPALAQHAVDMRRSAARDGRVEIENAAGSVRVIGWERGEVEVKGMLGAGAEDVDLSGNANRIRIDVETQGNPHGVRSDLEIHVPAGSRVDIESYSAEVVVTDVTGAVHVESVEGSISVTGATKTVELQTVSGAVAVTGANGRVQAESVNGSVTLTSVRGEVEASSVNGRVQVSGSLASRGAFETVSGGVRFDGELAKGASLDIESVSGSVEVSLPTNVSADFTLSTFSGSIKNDLGPAPHRTSKYTSEQELTFSTGGGGTAISIKTLSGSITLRKK
jgi:DUF4097 and DUF4098 domain-containing protein YvlB